MRMMMKQLGIELRIGDQPDLATPEDLAMDKKRLQDRQIKKFDKERANGPVGYVYLASVCKVKNDENFGGIGMKFAQKPSKVTDEWKFLYRNKNEISPTFGQHGNPITIQKAELWSVTRLMWVLKSYLRGYNQIINFYLFFQFLFDFFRLCDQVVSQPVIHRSC